MTGVCIVRVYVQDSGDVVIQIVSEATVETAERPQRWTGRSSADALRRVDDFLVRASTARDRTDGPEGTAPADL